MNKIVVPIPAGTTILTIPDITINITVSGPTNVSIERLTAVPSYMDPNATGLFDFGLYIEIILDPPTTLETLVISFNYSAIEDDILSHGLSISDLGVYFFNETSQKWELADKVEIDLEKKIITGYFDHTTTIGVLGRSKATTGPGIDPALLLLAGGIIAIAAIGGSIAVYYFRKKEI